MKIRLTLTRHQALLLSDWLTDCARRFDQVPAPAHALLAGRMATELVDAIAMQSQTGGDINTGELK